MLSVAHAASPNYYTQDDIAAQRPWQGPPHAVWLTSVAELGITAGHAIEAGLFRYLAQGLRPDGTTLDPRLRQGGRSRWAIDLSFGAPKDVSIAWLLGDRAERGAIEWAHHRAVVAALKPVLETPWTARRGKRGLVRETVPVPPAAAFLQFAARPTRDDEMPAVHLHSQAVVFNLSRRSGARWGAVELHRLFQNQRQMRKTYHDECEAGLAAWGFGVDRSTAGYVMLPGLDRQLVAAFSPRSRAIRKALAQGDDTGARQRNRIAIATRGRKPLHLTLNDLLEHWQRRVREVSSEPDDASVVPAPMP